jgi:hypothetical protein
MEATNHASQNLPTRTTRLTPKVHEELRDRISILAEDAQWLDDNGEEAAATAIRLNAKLQSIKPGERFEIDGYERELAVEYLRDLAEVTRDSAEFTYHRRDSALTQVAKRGAQHSFAERLDRAADELEAGR